MYHSPIVLPAFVDLVSAIAEFTFFVIKKLVVLIK